jgi:3-hydroxymyristoyl/3-hydroxydecanoyl-(acyl carrier protein) dehydratase
MEAIAMERTLTLAVDPAHPAFAGHFPGTPIVPGVLLIDWAVCAIQEAEAASGRVGELSVVKFHSPVRPGEQLSLHYSIQKSSIQKNSDAAGAAKIIFRIECDTRPIASGTLKWMDASQ